MSDENGGGERGRIGHEIFDQVEKLVNEEGLSRTQAFQRVSDETGRRAGTVAANYYRVARQRGAQLQPRTPRGARARGRAAGTGVDAALAKAQEALRELGDVVRRQEKELESLRAQAEQYQKLKALVSKSI
jgi:hypothetical protein